MLRDCKEETKERSNPLVILEYGFLYSDFGNVRMARMVGDSGDCKRIHTAPVFEPLVSLGIFIDFANHVFDMCFDTKRNLAHSGICLSPCCNPFGRGRLLQS